MISKVDTIRIDDDLVRFSEGGEPMLLINNQEVEQLLPMKDCETPASHFQLRFRRRSGSPLLKETLMMVRIILLFTFALFFPAAPEGSAGEKGDLTQLREVRIVVEDSNSHMREMGLTKDVIKKQVLGLLLGKLPRVVINDSAKPFVYINVNVLYGTMGNRRKYYFGNVNVQVKQPVIKKNTSEEISASVWSISHVLTGPPTSAPDHVRNSIETILNSLAADWYLDNPVK